MGRPKKQKPPELEKNPHGGWTNPSDAELKEIVDKYTKPVGRPPDYTPEFGAWICEIIATNPYGLEKISKLHDGFPHMATIWSWKGKYKEFDDMYRLAKLRQAELMTEEIVNIADETQYDEKLNFRGEEVTNVEAINRSKLKIDTRKWLAAKLLPRQFGDQQRIETLESQNDELRRQLAEYREREDEKNKREF